MNFMIFLSPLLKIPHFYVKDKDNLVEVGFF